MSITLVRKSQIRPLNIIRSDINTTTSGSALITKVIAGTGLALSSSTGVNPGTGDVTIALSIATASVLGGVKIGSGLTVAVDGTISVSSVSTTWGSITGLLSNQTDLQAALNAKYNNPTGTTSQYIDGTGAYQTFPLGLPTAFVRHEVKAGVAIAKGQAVYVSSSDGTNMIVGLASNATEATSSKTMGLLDATVNINGFANVVTEGLLAGLNTIGANAGDPVWLGTGGNLLYGLANKPYAPKHLVFIGIVTRVNANNGEIFVKVQNGFELDEIHDVDLKTTTPINGHILGYNGTLWVNKTIAGWLGYTPQDAATAITTSNIGSQSVNYANTSGNADTFDGIDSSRFIYGSGTNRRGTNNISNWNQTDYPDVAFLSAENGGANAPTSDYTYGVQYSFHRSGAAYRTQLVTSLYSDTSIYVRNSRDSDVWTSWKRLWHSEDFTSTNISNWNTAYSWGNHSTQGYATQTYVNNAVAALVDSAPSTLDTLNELAAALGDDPNFATTVTNNIANKVSKSGDTMTGNLNWAQTDRGLTWGMNTDGAYIKFFNTGDGDSDSRLEYATSDNDDEYHRWVIAGTERMNLRTEGLNVNGVIYSSGYGNSTEWNTAYSWGNHAGLYASISHTHTFASITSKPTTIAGYGITNAYTDAQIQNFFNGANAITGYNKSNWDTAYSWGNHASAGYRVNSINNTAYVYATSYRTENYDFTLDPRLSIDSMSIKLWDNYFNNSGLGVDYGSLLDIHGRGGHVHSQFYMDASNLLWYRSSPYASGWNTWQQIWTSGTLTNLNQLINGPGYITGYTETNTFLGDGGNADTHPGTSRIIFTGQLSAGSALLGMPATDNSNSILNINRHPGEYNSQLGFSSNGSMYYRSFSAVAINSTQSWRQVWDSGNLTNLNQLVNGPGYITGYTETDTLASVTARGATTSTPSVFRGGLYGQKAQTVNNYTTAALWTESYDNTTTGIAFHISGVVGKFLEMRTNGILYWEDRQVWTAGNLTSLSQLSNDPGYLTSLPSHNHDDRYYTESESDTRFATAGHTHDLMRYSLRAPGNVDSLTSANFREQLFGTTANGWTISTARWNTTPTGLSGMNSYGTMFAWSGSDTHGFIATDYSTANIQVGGGNGNLINWKATLIHSSNIGSQSVSYATTAGALSSMNISQFTNNSGYITSAALGSYLPLSGGTLSGALNMTSELAFRDGAGTFSNIIRAAAYPSEGYPDGVNYWLEYQSKGGHHFVLNTDGGVGGGPNTMDDFIVWQGAIDGDRLLELTNVGDLIISGRYTEQSSLRYKENIISLESITDKVDRLRPVRYNKIGNTNTEIGLIAEEVAEVFPEFVNYNANGEVESLNYTRLSVVLLQTVKELSDKINKLETK